MGTKMGFEGHVYYNTTLITGSVPSSTWVAIDQAQDVTLIDAMREVDVETKAAAGVEETEPGSRMGGIEFRAVYDPSDSALTALRTAYVAKTKMSFALMDDAMGTGIKGTVFNGKITKFEKSQPIKGEQAVSITIKPCFGSKLQDYTAS